MKQEKVAFFSPPSLKKSPEWPKKLPKKGFFYAKKREESIGHDFKALSQAILPEIDDLCKLPSELHTEKKPITTL